MEHLAKQQNRIYNAKNPAQGEAKRVLCVCSAGLLRSPTAAVVLSQEPFNFNTRAAGLEDSYALIPVDAVLLAWADEVVCMTAQHAEMLQAKLIACHCVRKSVKVLNISDDYRYRDPELMRLIAERYAA